MIQPMRAEVCWHTTVIGFSKSLACRSVMCAGFIEFRESVQKLQVFLSLISYKCLLHVFCGKKEIVPQIMIVSSRGDDFINIPLRFKQLLNKSFT